MKFSPFPSRSLISEKGKERERTGKERRKDGRGGGKSELAMIIPLLKVRKAKFSQYLIILFPLCRD